MGVWSGTSSSDLPCEPNENQGYAQPARHPKPNLPFLLCDKVADQEEYVRVSDRICGNCRFLEARVLRSHLWSHCYLECHGMSVMSPVWGSLRRLYLRCCPLLEEQTCQLPLFLSLLAGTLIVKGMVAVGQSFHSFYLAQLLKLFLESTERLASKHICYRT